MVEATRVVYSCLGVCYDEPLRQQKKTWQLERSPEKEFSSSQHNFDSTFYTREENGLQHSGNTRRFDGLGHWLPAVEYSI